MEIEGERNRQTSAGRDIINNGTNGFISKEDSCLHYHRLVVEKENTILYALVVGGCMLVFSWLFMYAGYVGMQKNLIFALKEEMHIYYEKDAEASPQEKEAIRQRLAEHHKAMLKDLSYVIQRECGP